MWWMEGVRVMMNSGPVEVYGVICEGGQRGESYSNPDGK